MQPYLHFLPFKVEASQAVIQSRDWFWNLLDRSVLLQLGKADYSGAGVQPTQGNRNIFPAYIYHPFLSEVDDKMVQFHF